MENTDYKNKIDELVKHNEYKDLYIYIEKFFNNANIVEIKNYIRYKELLLNKKSSITKRKYLIEPLKKYLRTNIKDSTINNYIKCCDLINNEYAKINKYGNEQFEKLYSYNFMVVMMSILSKVENYNHKLIKESGVIDNQFHYLDKRRDYLIRYQNNVEGLNIILKFILENQNRFSVRKVWSNREGFISNTDRCSKKTFAINDLVSYLESNVKIMGLCKEIEKYDLSVISQEDGQVLLEYSDSDIEAYKKKNIAWIRCYLHDLNHGRKYSVEVNERYEKLKDKIDDINFQKIMIYNDSSNSFALKFDMLSNEFLDVFIDVFKEFKFQESELLNNSFINSEVDNLITTDTYKLDFTYKDIINFYYILCVFSSLYFNATICFYDKKKRSPNTPFIVLDIDTIYNIVSQMYKLIYKIDISKNKLQDLINFYTFSNDNICDLYYKPIIQVENSIILIPSIFQVNNFNRTFLTHMNKIKANFKSGNLFEDYIKDLFKKNDFLVYDKKKPRLNFKMKNGEQGDIDLLTVKGKYVFYGQIKNRANPIEDSDYIAFDRKINRKAISQLKYAKEYLLSNPHNIMTEFFNIEDLNEYEFIPFILTNSFYSSGDKKGNIYIIDSSALRRYFTDGSIKIIDGDGNIKLNKILKTENIEEGLVELLKRPYFKDENLYHNLYIPRAYPVCNTLFVLKFKNEIIEKHIESCYLGEELKNVYLDKNK